MKEGRRYFINATKRPWNGDVIKRAGEEGSGGWQCDYDRRAAIWAVNNVEALIDKVEKLEGQLRAAYRSADRSFNPYQEWND